MKTPSRRSLELCVDQEEEGRGCAHKQMLDKIAAGKLET